MVFYKSLFTLFSVCEFVERCSCGICVGSVFLRELTSAVAVHPSSLAVEIRVKLITSLLKVKLKRKIDTNIISLLTRVTEVLCGTDFIVMKLLLSI